MMSLPRVWPSRLLSQAFEASASEKVPSTNTLNLPGVGQLHHAREHVGVRRAGFAIGARAADLRRGTGRCIWRPDDGHERASAAHHGDGTCGGIGIGCVEHEVDVLHHVFEFLALVVDDLVDTERAQEIVIVRRGGADDAGAGRLGDLHGGGTHSTRGAMDEHGLPTRDFSGLVQGAIGSLGRDGHAGGLFEGHGLRFAREAVDRDDGVFGVAAALARETEHLLAHLPVRDTFTD